MNTRSACRWGFVFVGVVLMIPGIVLLYQFSNCDDDDSCSENAGIALLIIGFLILLIGACNFCVYGTSSKQTGQYGDPVTAERVRRQGEMGRINGDALAQMNAQQQQWVNQQQAQMQWSINNPV